MSGISFPIGIALGNRKFEVHALDTRELWYLYSEYESLIVSLVGTKQEVQLDSAMARRLVDLMDRLIGLCVEPGVGKVALSTSFSPGDRSPLLLTKRVAEVLFGPLLGDMSQGGFQPIVEVLAAPLLASSSGTSSTAPPQT